MEKEKNVHEIVVQGLFKLQENKNYVLLNGREEVGTLEVSGDNVFVVYKDEDKEDEEFTNTLDLQNFINNNGFVLTQDSIRWLKFNPNPANNEKANDCSIRAYCAAEDITWDEAYDIACQYGKASGFMPNDSHNCDEVLIREFGYEYVKLKKEQKGMTVNEFAVQHPNGTYVLSVGGHLVTVINGEYYDSWDSGKKKLKGYYVNPS